MKKKKNRLVPRVAPIQILMIIVGGFMFYFSAPFFYMVFTEMSKEYADKYPRHDFGSQEPQDMLFAGFAAILVSSIPFGFVTLIIEDGIKKALLVLFCVMWSFLLLLSSLLVSVVVDRQWSYNSTREGAFEELVVYCVATSCIGISVVAGAVFVWYKSIKERKKQSQSDW